MGKGHLRGSIGAAASGGARLGADGGGGWSLTAPEQVTGFDAQCGGDFVERS